MTQTDSFGSWDLYVSRFKSYMMVERQLATQTVSAYLSDVAHFLGFLKDQPIALETIRAFMTELSARGYEPTSISRKLSTLSLFCEFLRNEKVLSESIDCHYFLPKKGFYFMPRIP